MKAFFTSTAGSYIVGNFLATWLLLGAWAVFVGMGVNSNDIWRYAAGVVLVLASAFGYFTFRYEAAWQKWMVVAALTAFGALTTYVLPIPAQFVLLVGFIAFSAIAAYEHDNFGYEGIGFGLVLFPAVMVFVMLENHVLLAGAGTLLVLLAQIVGAHVSSRREYDVERGYQS